MPALRPFTSAPSSKAGWKGGRRSFLPACSSFFPSQRALSYTDVRGQEMEEGSSSQSGRIIEATYRAGKIQDWCSDVSFKPCLLYKIGTKSHVLVPSQSQGDAHGREKAIML